jgi:large subunit ribosomal protein L1
VEPLLFAPSPISRSRAGPPNSQFRRNMAPIDRCLASMARLSLLQTPRPVIPTIPKFLAPAAAQQVRQASVVRIKKTTKKKKPLPKDFKRHNLNKREFPQYSLCEAMRSVHRWDSRSVNFKQKTNIPQSPPRRRGRPAPRFNQVRNTHQPQDRP